MQWLTSGIGLEWMGVDNYQLLIIIIVYMDMGEKQIVSHEPYEENEEKILRYIVDSLFQLYWKFRRDKSKKKNLFKTIRPDFTGQTHMIFKDSH